MNETQRHKKLYKCLSCGLVKELEEKIAHGISCCEDNHYGTEWREVMKHEYLALDWYLIKEVDIPVEFERKYIFVNNYECNSETLVLFMFLKSNILKIDIKKYHEVTADIKYEIEYRRNNQMQR